MEAIWDWVGKAVWEVVEEEDEGPWRRKGRVCARQFMCSTKRQRGSASDMSMPGWLVLVGG